MCLGDSDLCDSEFFFFILFCMDVVALTGAPVIERKSGCFDFARLLYARFVHLLCARVERIQLTVKTSTRVVPREPFSSLEAKDEKGSFYCATVFVSMRAMRIRAHDTSRR